MEELKHLILTSSEPFVIKNKLDWKILNWSLPNWEKVLRNEEMEFRCGTNAATKAPQWERTTNMVKTNFKSFLAMRNSPDSWMYYDYKYLKDHLINIDEIRKDVNWTSFGFTDVKPEDSTIWIGSKGAHTPCHQDTYGCNLVAQVYGEKQWLLFPAAEDLKSSRIPYEESSVYSKLNFFSPTNLNDFSGIEQCRRVVLKAGDVLFVPNKWWHYVENLDTAISVNVWLPLPQDDGARLEESIVQLLVSQIVKDLGDEDKQAILNPNSTIVDFNECLKVINRCKEICKDNRSYERCPKENLNLKEETCIEEIPRLSQEDFSRFIEEQKNRFTKLQQNEENGNCNVVDLISAVTDPEVIALIRSKLLS